MGKSSLIGCISHALSISAMDGINTLLFLSPFGISTFNIRRKMIHSSLKIPVKDIKPHYGHTLVVFQEEMR